MQQQQRHYAYVFIQVYIIRRSCILILFAFCVGQIKAVTTRNFRPIKTAFKTDLKLTARVTRRYAWVQGLMRAVRGDVLLQ